MVREHRNCFRSKPRRCWKEYSTQLHRWASSAAGMARTTAYRSKRTDFERLNGRHLSQSIIRLDRAERLLGHSGSGRGKSPFGGMRGEEFFLCDVLVECFPHQSIEPLSSPPFQQGVLFLRQIHSLANGFGWFLVDVKTREDFSVFGSQGP